jgi:hypothetical protein
MTEEAQSYFEESNNFLVNVMFFSSPKELVSLKDSDTKYIYTIFCLQIIESGDYFIFHKMFKPLKRKNKYGFMFHVEDSTTQLFKRINEANSYVNNFISSFGEHERQSGNLSDTDDNLPAGEAILTINNWEKSVLERFGILTKN